MHSQLPRNFRSSYEYPIHYQSENSIKVPPIMLTFESRMVSIFSAHCPISFKHIFLTSILRSTPNHIPLKYRCPYYCLVRIMYIYLNAIVSLNLFSEDIVYEYNHATRMDTITASIHSAEGCSNYNHETMQQQPIHCSSKELSITHKGKY